MRLLIEAIEDVRNNLGYGIECPCCGQYARQYTRKLNSSMAASLIKAFNLTRTDHNKWIHVTTDLPYPMAVDFSKLRHWRLVESKNVFSEDGNSAGEWRLTPFGRLFVEGLETVPAKVKLYNNEVRGFSGEKIYIRQALGIKFNYNELMNDRL